MPICGQSYYKILIYANIQAKNFVFSLVCAARTTLFAANYCICQKKAVLLHPLLIIIDFYSLSLGIEGFPTGANVVRPVGRAEASVARLFSGAV